MTTLFDFLKETSLKNMWLFLRVIKPLKEWPQCTESLKMSWQTSTQILLWQKVISSAGFPG